MYKERKETTHREIGEEYIHYYYYYYYYYYTSKISTMYINMVTRSVYKKLKEAPKTTKR